METTPASRTSKSPAPSALSTCLLLLAWLSAVVGVVAVVRLVWQGHAEGPQAVPAVLAVGLVALSLLGLGGGAALWAASWVVRRQYERLTIQRRNMAVLDQISAQIESVKAGVNRPAAATADVDLMQRVLAELAEINTNLLLSDAQREAKRRAWQMQQSRRLAELAEQHISAGRLDEARDTLAQLLAEVPDTPHVRELEQRLAKARHAARAAEISGQVQRVKELMAAASFEAAEQAARQLAARHPDSADAGMLLEQVRREAAAYDAEQRRKLYEAVDSHAKARQWRAAAGAAKRFLEAYPKGPEADLVRAQLQTITDNAQIEEVRELRDRIRDLINRRRFPEAFELARDLVARFPHTAAAEELRGQMDKLAQMGKKEK
ncbi:MAG: outer membrane protein assembly factor BamD [Phycisphaerae bacterium]